MHKQIVSILVAALITLSLEAGAATQVNVERDTRIVSDTRSLDMAAISAQKDQIWVVAEVAPDATDGQFEGVKKDAKTGIYTQLPGQPVVQVHKGIFNVISPIVGMPPAQAYAYEWDLPANIVNQYLVTSSGTQDPYLAFYENNIVVCRINGNLPAISVTLYDSKFYPLYLVPIQWKTYIAPAVAYIHENFDLFQSDNLPKDVDRLWKLTNDHNPFIAIAALRVLFQNSQIGSSRLLHLLMSTTGLKQAVFMFEVLSLRPQQPPPISTQALVSVAIQQPVVEIIQELTQKASSSAELEGLALGIWSASATPVGRRGENNSAKISRLNLLYGFLEEIQKKQNTFHTHTEEDARLGHWLRAADVPQKP